MSNDTSSANPPDDSDMITIEGVVKRSPLGPGAWTIAGMGRTVQIFRNQPQDILKENLKVRVTGKMRPDIMTAAMVGPVFEVIDFQILDG